MMSLKKGKLRVGTSGYQYDHWKKIFYSEELSKKDWFSHYAKIFDTVEINNTFYHLPSESTFDDWRERAPPGFCYVLKFSRYGSHLKHLKDPEDTISLFLKHADRLGESLGPILVQLRPDWHVDVNRLAAFLDVAPDNHRWAFEFRDKSWLCDEVYDVLRCHDAALCIHDLIDNHPREITADWVYLRYHGGNHGGNYSCQFLSVEAKRIQKLLSEGKDVYAYFNNDAHGYAIANALDIRRYVLKSCER